MSYYTKAKAIGIYNVSKGKRKKVRAYNRRAPTIVKTRYNLTVPYEQKEEAKAHGARWDEFKRTWYVWVCSRRDLKPFARWHPQLNQNRSLSWIKTPHWLQPKVDALGRVRG